MTRGSIILNKMVSDRTSAKVGDSYSRKERVAAQKLAYTTLSIIEKRLVYLRLGQTS